MRIPVDIFHFSFFQIALIYLFLQSLSAMLIYEIILYYLEMHSWFWIRCNKNMIMTHLFIKGIIYFQLREETILFKHCKVSTPPLA